MASKAEIHHVGAGPGVATTGHSQSSKLLPLLRHGLPEETQVREPNCLCFSFSWGLFQWMVWG